jgi:hypothetical protein
MSDDDNAADEVHFTDIAPAIEFVCWVMVALAPMLRVMNGAAVTTDQFVIQMALFSLSLISGIGLRVYNCRHRK